MKPRNDSDSMVEIRPNRPMNMLVWEKKNCISSTPTQLHLDTRRRRRRRLYTPAQPPRHAAADAATAVAVTAVAQVPPLPEPRTPPPPRTRLRTPPPLLPAHACDTSSRASTSCTPKNTVAASTPAAPLLKRPHATPSTRFRSLPRRPDRWHQVRFYVIFSYLNSDSQRWFLHILIVSKANSF
jgi:hypothetical protein